MVLKNAGPPCGSWADKAVGNRKFDAFRAFNNIDLLEVAVSRLCNDLHALAISYDIRKATHFGSIAAFRLGPNAVNIGAYRVCPSADITTDR